MIDSRRKGIFTVHGLLTALILPAWFFGYWFLYARFGPGLVLVDSKADLYVIGLMLTSLTFFGYYPRLQYRRQGGGLMAAMEVAAWQLLTVALTIFAITFLAQEKNLSRWFVVSFLLTTGALLTFINYYLPSWLSQLLLGQHQKVTTLLIGSSHVAQKLWGWLKSQEEIGVRVAGLVTESEEDKGLLGVKHLGKVWELDEILAHEKADTVILMESMLSPERLRAVFKQCQRSGARILVYSYWEDLLNYPLAAISEGGTTFFTLGQEPLENPVNRFWKRTLDIVVSLPVCLILLPLLTLWVKGKQKKESPGPLFFKQARAGKGGKTFMVYKFRTMHVRENDANDTKQAQKGDERVFKFGEWMRRRSVDELPQFWNVLRGEMSVVGPRPHMLAHDALFTDYIDLYRSRHFVKPGITGLAQVNGYRGEISEMSLLEKRVRYDIEYITQWTLWMDVVIILKTAAQVIKPHKSAY